MATVRIHGKERDVEGATLQEVAINALKINLTAEVWGLSGWKRAAEIATDPNFFETLKNKAAGQL